MKLLHIDASILDEQSVSRQLTAEIVQQFMMSDPQISVTYHDLAHTFIPHLSGAEFLALQGIEPKDELIKQNIAQNAQYLDEFLVADVVIIGAPMYNFSLPSQLKAWLDRLSVAGKTFRYTESGSEGLVKGKRLIIASTRGGLYSEGMPAADFDYQETYLKAFFSFLGIDEVTFVRAEGLAMGPDIRQTALNTANEQIEKLAS